MRWSRLLIAAGLALTLLGAGLAAAATGARGSARVTSGAGGSAPRLTIAAPASRSSSSMLRELRRLQLQPPFAPAARGKTAPIVIPRDLAPPLPGGSPCFVAGGACALMPCIEFAGAASGSVVARTSDGLAVELLAVPHLGPARQPTGPTCRGRLGAPHTVLVGGA